MAVFETGQGEYWQSSHLGQSFGVHYRIFEEDHREGMAWAIVEQLPASAPIHEVIDDLEVVLRDLMEESSLPLMLIERQQPEDPFADELYFLIESGERRAITSDQVDCFILPHTMADDYLK